MILRALLLALSTRPRIGEWMNRLPVTRGFVRRFVAGTAADDALAVIADLNARGLQGGGTYLGENIPTPAAAEHATQVYARLPADVERLVELGATVRLCKGAYREPREIAYPDKRDVDQAYARLIDRLLAPDALGRGVYPGFATHDERLIARVRDRAAERRIAADRLEIQMLYGIRPDLGAALRAQGLAVRVLVPFGEDWYGYFMRRLAERPANLLFLLRNLGRG